MIYISNICTVYNMTQCMKASKQRSMTDSACEIAARMQLLSFIVSACKKFQHSNLWIFYFALKIFKPRLCEAAVGDRVIKEGTVYFRQAYKLWVDILIMPHNTTLACYICALKQVASFQIQEIPAFYLCINFFSLFQD